MTETQATPHTIEVMWRPRCPFCGSLRRGLSRQRTAYVANETAT